MITQEDIKNFCKEKDATVEELVKVIEELQTTGKEYQPGDFKKERERLEREGRLKDSSNLSK